MGYNCLSSVFSICTPTRKKKRDINKGEKTSSFNDEGVSQKEDSVSTDILDAYNKTEKKTKTRTKIMDLDEIKKSLDQIQDKYEKSELKKSKKKMAPFCSKEIDKKKIKKLDLKNSKQKKESSKKKKKNTKISSSEESEISDYRPKKKPRENKKARNFLSNDDLESFKKTNDLESESEVCMQRNEAQQLKFNANLYKKMLRILTDRNKTKNQK